MVARRGASHFPSSQEPKRPLQRKPAPSQQGKETSRNGGSSGNQSNPQASQASTQASNQGSQRSQPSQPISTNSQSLAQSAQANSVISFSGYREASYSQAAEAKFKRQRAQQNKTRGIEAVVVIAVNIFLSAAAVIALTKLLPYQSVQKERLDTISAEVESAEQRVNALRAKLPQTFDSGKSQEVFLRKQGWIKPNQMTIKLVEPGDIATPNGEYLPSTSTAQKPSTKTSPATPSIP
ncbi:hypothetical protein V2H45_17870 [Tumidithrix elongata RA019]|uniref:Cell division protein FtsL n=1 Tax=Tumidithrix elongata BACA0141 TaxID=2716417 RepID=A0AAW9PUJ7_9CYAN|nr:hypothetical protein [Tumidithrix elongata RA019]